MPKWLLEVLTRIQQWDLATVLALTWGTAMDQEMEVMALVVWEVMDLVMVVWEMEWEAMALGMVAWEEAWAQEMEEVMAWTDAAKRSMLKVHQILT